jgi:hypothetical protein
MRNRKPLRLKHRRAQLLLTDRLIDSSLLMRRCCSDRFSQTSTRGIVRPDLDDDSSRRIASRTLHRLFMFFRAAFKAASGLVRPLVASSNAAFIELQNLPI